MPPTIRLNRLPAGRISSSATPLTIARVGGNYELNWSEPVRGGPVTEYELYRVDLASGPGPLTPRCEASFPLGTSAVVADLPANHGFLLVARNSVGEGILGRDSQAHDRPSPAEADVCP